jgi:hypothetical protein
MFSKTNMLKHRELNILGQLTASTDGPGMSMKYFQCSSRFQPTHFLIRKRTPTLGYTVALIRQNSRTRGCSRGEAEIHLNHGEEEEATDNEHELAAIARQ